MAEGCKKKDLEDMLIIWIRQVQTNNVTGTDEVIKDQVKILEEQMYATNFEHKICTCFASKNGITVKMNSLVCKTVLLQSVVTYCNFASSFTLKIITTVFCTPYSTLTY
jgi:hypothetical protein